MDGNERHRDEDDRRRTRFDTPPRNTESEGGGECRTAVAARGTHPGRLLATVVLLLGCGCLTVPLALARDNGGASAGDGWLAAATAEIRRAEYRFERGVDGGWSAPNRAHGLRVRIENGDLWLTPRLGGAGEAAWHLRLQLVGYGREGSVHPAPAPVALDAGSESGTRVEIDRGDLVEWYVNGPDGVEQGFTIYAPPSGAGNHAAAGSRDPGEAPLILEMDLGGAVRARLTGDARAALLSAPGYGEILRYEGLLVVDATGAPIPAALRIAGDRLRISVDDAAAVYPLQVDPFFTSVAWSVQGDMNEEAGRSVATAGDVNCDGFSDVLVGVPQWSGTGAVIGGAFLFLGSPAGPSTVPDWQASSDSSWADFGHSVATAGDVNDDGCDDILVGAPGYGNGGAAFLWLGGPGGPGAPGTPSNADWSHVESSQIGADFGWSVAAAGDVDGDGDDDVLIGAPRFTNDDDNEGRAFLYLGVSSGLAIFPAWSAESDQSCADIFCAQAGFGTSVAGAGDLNGDGFADIAIGAPRFENGTSREGAVFVWYGHAGLPSGPDGRPTNASWFAESGQANAALGDSVAGVGDVDGDGFADLLVGAGSYDGPTAADAGTAFLWLGGAVGLGPIGSPANADWSSSSDQWNDGFGEAVATAGDVNGDGFADILIGAPRYHDFGFEFGGAFLWLGGPGGPAPAGTIASSDWGTLGASTSARGFTVATAGDVNGDGYGDFLIGAPLYDVPGNGPDNGRAALYLGTGNGIAGFIVPTLSNWQAASGTPGAELGTSVTSAGDVNGDGYSDLLLGAPFFDDGQPEEGKVFLFLGSPGGLFLTPSWSAASGQATAHLGASVAAAGDLNGDGYADIAIGAPNYDKTAANEGSVFVWHGGPATGPDPSGLGADGTPGNADWSFVSGTLGAGFGSAVASAGDVNADGVGDLIVAAPDYTNGETFEGKVWVFAGSAGGSPTLFWSLESDTLGWRLGDAVASAGDVNADGFGDIVLGMPFAELGPGDEGIFLVFHGGAVTIQEPLAFGISSGQADAHLGAAVAPAGDVNGDGYSDLLVGAPDYSTTLAGEGLAWVLHGSPLGVVYPPAWTAVGDVAGARLGAAVASAGDLDRDGFGDIVIGLPGYGTGGQAEEGAAAIWMGGAGGLGSGGSYLFNDGRVEGNQAGAALGTSVASAGDVNGDGFGDLLVGAPGFDDTEIDEGLARVWYGNFGQGGLHLAPRQFRADDSAPIGPLGLSDSGLSFRVRALGRTPAGRAGVWLEWEVKPLGVPFDGVVIGSAMVASDSGYPGFPDGSAVALSEELTGLAPGAFYHWRARIASDSPFFPRTPWFSPPANSPNETDLRTAGCVDRDGDGFGAPADADCLGGLLLDCDDGDPAVSPGAAEICNGLDDDCNALIDDGDPGGGFDCSTGLKGVCDLGATTCQGGTLLCEQTTFPSAEVCDNLDNDCDGTVDGFTTSCGVGECASAGTCVAGVDSCVPGTPQAEICDGLDNDCDGTLPPDEIDSDGDGLSTCQGDCDDANPGSIATPEDVTGVAIMPIASGYRFTWDSQDITSGRGTVFDVFFGTSSLVAPAGDFSSGDCLADNLASAQHYDDTSPDPPLGEVHYFLLRGQNACPVSTGTYGSANRDTTAKTSAGACD